MGYYSELRPDEVCRLSTALEELFEQHGSSVTYGDVHAAAQRVLSQMYEYVLRSREEAVREAWQALDNQREFGQLSPAMKYWKATSDKVRDFPEWIADTAAQVVQGMIDAAFLVCARGISSDGGPVPGAQVSKGTAWAELSQAS